MLTRTPERKAADRHAEIAAERGVDLVVEAGATSGAYGRALRRAGYTGVIVSLDADSGSFLAAKFAASDDRSWTVHEINPASRDIDSLGWVGGVAMLRLAMPGREREVLSGALDLLARARVVTFRTPATNAASVLVPLLGLGLREAARLRVGSDVEVALVRN